MTGSQDGTARLVNLTTQKVVSVVRHTLLASTAAEMDDPDTGVSIER